MQLFEKKPDQLEAMQFTGGAERARKIVKWLTDNGVVAEYRPNGGAYNARGEVFDTEQVVMTTPWSDQGAYVGDWFARDLMSGQFQMFLKDDFLTRYASVGEERNEELEVAPVSPEPEEVVDESPVVTEPEVEENIPPVVTDPEEEVTDEVSVVDPVEENVPEDDVVENYAPPEDSNDTN